MTERPENENAGGPPADGGMWDRDNWSAPRPEILPRPTPWPMVVAFGACLLAWGVVTSWIISGVGLIAFVIGIRGWIVELRDEQQRKRSAGGTD
jgi:hypothetical protein